MHNIKGKEEVVIQTIEVAFSAAAVKTGSSADLMSALLSEHGACSGDGVLLDWRYTGAERTVTAPEGCEEGEIFRVTNSTAADEQVVGKCFLAKLEERNGQYTYKHLFRYITAEDPFEVAKAQASIWYSDSPVPEEDGSYDFNGGEISVTVTSVQEISLETYKTLEGIVTDITGRHTSATKEGAWSCKLQLEKDGVITDLGSFQMFRGDNDNILFDYDGISEELVNRGIVEDDDLEALSVTSWIEVQLNEHGIHSGRYDLEPGKKCYLIWSIE